MEISSISSQSFPPQIKSQRIDKPSTEINRENIDVKVKQHEQAKEISDNISREKLEEVVKSMNQFLMPTNTSLKFKMHEDLKEYYVQIVDEKTKEVIREIPSKKMLDMYAAMKDFLGLVVDRKI